MQLNWRPVALVPGGYPIDTSITEKESWELTRLAAGKDVLEIGAGCGYSSTLMGTVAKSVTSIDHHQHIPDGLNKVLAAQQAYGVKCENLVGSSLEILPKLVQEGRKFDLVFIDGDHSSEGISNDYFYAMQLIRPGGMIAFHDYGEDSCPEVREKLDELFPRGTLRYLRDTLMVVKGKPLLGSELTVATLTIPGREDRLEALKREIKRQSLEYPVEHLIVPGEGSYGEKMAASIVQANGVYICWMDDDDWPEPNYIEEIVRGIHARPVPDVITFGSASPNCVPAWLRWGAKDNEGVTEDGGNIKAANHYCAWQVDLAWKAPWVPKNYGAEYLWYTALRETQHNVKEHRINKVLHEYRYDPHDTKCQNHEGIAMSFADGGRHVAIVEVSDGRIGVVKTIRPKEVYFSDGTIELWHEYRIIEDVYYH